MQRINESDEEFAARQKAGWDRFQAFADDLTRSGAELILRDIGSRAAKAIAEASRSSLLGIANQILALPRARLPRVANLASRIARALRAEERRVGTEGLSTCISR